MRAAIGSPSASAGERLEDDDAGALASNQSICARIEDPATAVGGEDSRFAEADARTWSEDYIDPACNGSFYFARPEALTGQVNRYKRRRAGGIHGEARPTKIQAIRNSIGRNAAASSAVGEGIDRQRIVVQQRGIIGTGYSDKDTRRAAGQRGGHNRGVFKRFPGYFQEQPLLGIHQVGFAGGDAEEVSVELIDFVEEPAPFRIHLSRCCGIGVIPGACVPPVGRNFTNCIGAS